MNFYTESVSNMGSLTESTEHAMSTYWNFYLMMVTLTETCSKLYIIEYIIVFWLNDVLLVVQHNGMAPIKPSNKLVCFLDRASRNNRVKKSQLDAQLIFSILRQPRHVSGICRPIIRRYKRMYTTTGTYYSFQMTVCCPGWIVPTQPGQQAVI